MRQSAEELSQTVREAGKTTAELGQSVKEKIHERTGYKPKYENPAGKRRDFGKNRIFSGDTAS